MGIVCAAHEGSDKAARGHLKCDADRMPYEMLNNQNAPFTGSYKIDVFAPPEKVWDWLSRVEMWASWRQDVTSSYWVRGEGPNGTMKWRLRGVLGFTARVEAWRREREMRWEAVSYGTRVWHALRIDGDFRRTLVTLEVAGHGGLLRFYPTRALFTHHVNRSNEIWLGALKTKLEAGKNDSIMPPSSTRNPFEDNVSLPSEQSRHDR